ncbi:hypothetical protein [Terriglobus roseus]|uniref:hypothetical protein n=1 Tax=Terriglobus roseus TaxID=392734 RepID=UPI0012F6A72C|nr:hypothetical protein [Terriglobus roseus]
MQDDEEPSKRADVGLKLSGPSCDEISIRFPDTRKDDFLDRRVDECSDGEVLLSVWIRHRPQKLHFALEFEIERQGHLDREALQRPTALFFGDLIDAPENGILQLSCAWVFPSGKRESVIRSSVLRLMIGPA